MPDYDNDDHIKNMQNSEANSYCPDGNPVLEFAGRQWWINYHWSQESGIYAGGQFDSIFDPKIIERTSDGVRLWIKPPGQYRQVANLRIGQCRKGRLWQTPYDCPR